MGPGKTWMGDVAGCGGGDSVVALSIQGGPEPALGSSYGACAAEEPSIGCNVRLRF